MSEKDLSEVRHAYDVYMWTRAQIAELEEQQKEARSVIEEHMGDAESGNLDGKRVIAWTYAEQRRLDVRRVRSLFPDIATACTEVRRVRSLRVVDDE